MYVRRTYRNNTVFLNTVRGVMNGTNLLTGSWVLVGRVSKMRLGLLLVDLPSDRLSFSAVDMASDRLR